jgi:hypothetical protein
VKNTKYKQQHVADALSYLLSRLKKEPSCEPISTVQTWAVTHDIPGRYVSDLVREVVSLIQFPREDRAPVFELRPMDFSRMTSSTAVQYHYAAQKTREAREFPGIPYPGRDYFRSGGAKKKTRKTRR